jgi:hypothetical protein
MLLNQSRTNNHSLTPSLTYIRTNICEIELNQSRTNNHSLTPSLTYIWVREWESDYLFLIDLILFHRCWYVFMWVREWLFVLDWFNSISQMLVLMYVSERVREWLFVLDWFTSTHIHSYQHLWNRIKSIKNK